MHSAAAKLELEQGTRPVPAVHAGALGATFSSTPSPRSCPTLPKLGEQLVDLALGRGSAYRKMSPFFVCFFFGGVGAGGIGIETPPHPRVVPPPGIRLWDSDWTAVGACALGLAQNQFAGRSAEWCGRKWETLRSDCRGSGVPGVGFWGN